MGGSFVPQEAVLSVEMLGKIGIGRRVGLCRHGRGFVCGRGWRLVGRRLLPAAYGYGYDHQKNYKSNQDPTPIYSHEFYHLSDGQYSIFVEIRQFPKNTLVCGRVL
jgi:hypothetical protein